MLKSEEIVAALRMLLSKDGLVHLRQVRNEPSLVESLYDKNHILELGAEQAGSKEKLRTSLAQWFSGKDDLPSFVIIDGIGTYSVERELCDKRMARKVVVVTGGAQGFGAGLAASFFREGANLLIADVNVEVGNAFVKELNESSEHACNNMAAFVKTDVSSYDSVAEMINKTVMSFGGVDVMISNAGILRAGGLDEMTPETFALMTKVNYEGYFNCAKAVSKIMKLQSEFSDEHFFDIIQINSKSGLSGSNKNFAYAGGKFGGIGLTQSFALELMPSRIKVNSICPGNFFDGPLWAHPETGLFVQYLKTGKVPGAKTIQDVKAFYEKQVPAGRGCGTEDVARAAFYAIEQEYETGQAIPVTGGQIMLN